ncbi:MAG: AarF/UbiB family protein [Alcanivorax sp.]|nr:AarF/UbiB family protein [Alcanivorax sp.]
MAFMSAHDKPGSEPPEVRNWQPLDDFAAGKQPDSGLKAWLSIIEGCIRAIERTAWQGRGIADQAVNACRAVGRGANAVNVEMQLLADEARRWPARLKRLAKTGWMLTKVVTSYRLWGTKSAFLPSGMRERSLANLHQRNARRFRETSLEQGGAFLKIGQLLSSRPDLLPQAWVEELSILQDQATPEPFSAIRQVLEEEFRQPLDTLFAEFDPEPLASASIGQVHWARLHDGRQVAVKVQRPGLDEVVELDMALLKVFMDCVKSALPPMDVDTIVNEIQRSVREELDYCREANAMQRIGRQLQAVEGVRVPRLIRSLSRRRVLTSEFIHGNKLTDVLEHSRDQEPAQLDSLLTRLLDTWFTQVLHGGLFHADPHPGNILVDHDGNLVLLDFGCCQTLTDDARHGYFRVLQACVVKDHHVIAETLNQMGFITRSGNPQTLLAFVSAVLDQVLEAIVNPHLQQGWPSAEQMMQQVTTLLTRLEHDPVEKMPGDFIMLARVFGTLGGLFLHYQPRLDVASLMLGYLTRPLDTPQAA